MTLFERISELAKKRGKSLKEVAEDLGLSRNAIYQWRTSSPKADTLQKVAKYFNVTTDYLLDGTDTPLGLSEESKGLTVEEALASVMSSDGKPLTDNDRRILTGIIEAYIENKNDAK
ncbi:helix-turn-helix domain-containing protein [Enterococcus mundtii]|uniref:Transcriptional regulator n=1 Tax=Enterococcus mundtii TaxID=53346 RepID=A0ABQ0VAL5_ENTMU|nr:helix-turn-helix transcriptional regulator [Enterococcus mundtii]GEN16876.1 transcriptional regulator [Ligilactobacillus acidipiscis]AUB52192.1 transcriptional regulator [Enterococcus mundtii]MZZ57664.1 helix-turn-helix domain-containing protein [Enterococcus mundtii]MZZ60639.1 helix-turn-helix domain-containing protein [Enterococcus mundtii]MZZ67624.1 helix-turn-helix domain-containing protein [Enterococcus mundtii]